MTLAASGELSLGPVADPTRSIVTEFGSFGTPYNLGNYFRGGFLVPDIPANANIPQLPPISILDFYGASST